MIRWNFTCKNILEEMTPILRGKSQRGPSLIYENVRYHSRFHQHIRYSRIPAKPRKCLIDPKQMDVGKPASPSSLLGDMAEKRKFEFDLASMNARGFLRFQKPYDPPEDAFERVVQLCKTCLNTTEDGENLKKKSLGDSRQKYELLTMASAEFQHAVPNSLLHLMNNVGNIAEFYCTPVKTMTPYEELIRNKDLPPNIHVQKEPLRFHPDTDTVFGGQTAFNKCSTIVLGLRAKKKYRGYEAKMTWP